VIVLTEISYREEAAAWLTLSRLIDVSALEGKKVALMRHSFKDDHVEFGEFLSGKPRPELDGIPELTRSRHEKLTSLRLRAELARTFSSEHTKDVLTRSGELADLVLVFAGLGPSTSEYLGAFHVKKKIDFETCYEDHKERVVSLEEILSEHVDLSLNVRDRLTNLLDKKHQYFVKGLGFSGRPNSHSDTFYDLIPLSKEEGILEGMEGRLIVEWGDINWVRAFTKWKGSKLLDPVVLELRAPGFVMPFPGYQSIDLSFDELATIIANPTGNREWSQKLSSVKGVYLITIPGHGYDRLYVGAAHGQDGIWGRWKQYVSGDFDGTNQGLRKWLTDNKDAQRGFRYTLLQVMSKTAQSSEVLAAESHWKRCLGSRVFGLNEN
jgi:hypothetical protein